MLDRFSTIADGLDHPEGVASGVDGAVYAGGEAGQVYRVDGDAFVQFASTDGSLYGVTLDADGNVFGCDFGRAEVVRVTPTGEVGSYSKGTNERPMRVPNFAAFDDAGNLYVTDSGDWRGDDGLIFRITPDGETSVWAEDARAFPNGCCLTAEGDALLVVQTTARRVVRLPIRTDGSAGSMESVVDLPGSLPDGIALAVDGTMFVGCYRPDRVWKIPPGGSPEILAEDPDGVTFNQPANVAFIGPELDRLCISSLGGWALVAGDVDVTGLPLRYPSLA
jgi:sugar lactone lactonase YvrE